MALPVEVTTADPETETVPGAELSAFPVAETFALPVTLTVPEEEVITFPEAFTVTFPDDPETAANGRGSKNFVCETTGALNGGLTAILQVYLPNSFCVEIRSIIHDRLHGGGIGNRGNRYSDAALEITRPCNRMQTKSILREYENVGMSRLSI
jgi:hypothetical protein